MNERIKELVEQAGFKTSWQHADVQAIKMARFEKFAQLIVLECAAYLNGAMEVYTQSEQDLYDRGATKIKQHFGVE
jgi:hypothetical protein